MLLLALIGVASVFVGYDMSVSHRRLHKYGLVAERNLLTRELCKEVGVLNGLLGGVAVPHLMVSAVCLQFGWTAFYAFYLGWLTKQFGMTIASLQVERELDEIRARKAEPPQPGA